MKALHLLPLVALLLSSCASAVSYHEGKAGNETVWVAPGILSQQMLKNARITTPKGVTIEVGAYAGRTDPKVVGAVKDVAMLRTGLPVLKEIVSGQNAIGLKGTADPNKIPLDPNKIPLDPNKIPLDPNLE
jgi:uncharacterized protein YceK